jgi:hypothetical protein
MFVRLIVAQLVIPPCSGKFVISVKPVITPRFQCKAMQIVAIGVTQPPMTGDAAAGMTQAGRGRPGM